MFIREVLFYVLHYTLSGGALALTLGVISYRLVGVFPGLAFLPPDSVLVVLLPLGLFGGLVLGLRRGLAETRSGRFRRRAEIAKW